MFVVLAFAVTLFSQPVPLAVPRSADNSVLASEDAGETVAVYNLLVSLPRQERMGMFRDLPSAMKAAVWHRHLRRMQAEHPELSPEQRHAGLIRCLGRRSALENDGARATGRHPPTCVGSISTRTRHRNLP
jgi:hypothetical protein